MRSPRDQREFERQLKEFVQSGGRVQRYDSGVRGAVDLHSSWRLVGKAARKAKEQKGKTER